MASGSLLRWALGANLVLSAACALAALIGGAAVSEIAGLRPAFLVTGVGVGLVAFAAGIAATLVRMRIGQALLISGLDLLWVLGTLPLIVVPDLLTPAGDALVLVLAVLVGTLGLLQLAGVRAMLDAADGSGRHRHCIRVRSVADPERLWSVIRDLGGIARYSAGLSGSRIEGDAAVAEGAVRVCTDTAGRSWAEEVESLDDDRRSVVLRFRSDADDFPFPFEALTGGWSVAPDREGGSLVDIWWIVTPKRRRFGWLLVALMTVPLDRDMPRLVGAMERAALGQPVPDQAPRLALGYC